MYSDYQVCQDPLLTGCLVALTRSTRTFDRGACIDVPFSCHTLTGWVLRGLTVYPALLPTFRPTVHYGSCWYNTIRSVKWGLSLCHL